MTSHGELRLLPWSSPNGKPCFLSTDDSNSRLSRLADSTEVTQVNSAVVLLNYVHEVLDDRTADSRELRSLVMDLANSLRDILRVAESYKHRLPSPT